MTSKFLQDISLCKQISRFDFARIFFVLYEEDEEDTFHRASDLIPF